MEAGEGRRLRALRLRGAARRARGVRRHAGARRGAPDAPLGTGSRAGPARARRRRLGRDGGRAISDGEEPRLWGTWVVARAARAAAPGARWSRRPSSGRACAPSSGCTLSRHGARRRPPGALRGAPGSRAPASAAARGAGDRAWRWSCTRSRGGSRPSAWCCACSSRPTWRRCTTCAPATSGALALRGPVHDRGDRERLARRIGATRFALTGDALGFAVDRDGELVGDVSLSLTQRRAPPGRDRLHRPPGPPGPRLRDRGRRGGARPRASTASGCTASSARIEPRNAASARVLERLGMRREALLVENELVKGEWQSEAIYALRAQPAALAEVGDHPAQQERP